MNRYPWGRRQKAGCALVLFLFLLPGCAGSAQPTPRRVAQVGLILGTGGLGDRSFNDSAYSGLLEAQKRYGIGFQVLDHASDEANLEALRDLAEQGYDLIIGVGYENADYIRTLSTEFPERNFAVIDTEVTGENVVSILYREQEGDFLMGVLAAMLTESKIVGFVGGMEIPPLRHIHSGFVQGVAYQDPQVTVLTDYAGTFADPELGKTLALGQYAAGADIIYNAAGRTGLGVIEAARETGHLVLGTSNDQRYLAPGNVVGNRPKRVDMAVLLLVEETINGTFTPGTRSLGLKEGGLTLGPLDETLVTPAMLERLEDLKARIIAGKIVIAVEAAP